MPCTSSVAGFLSLVQHCCSSKLAAACCPACCARRTKARTRHTYPGSSRYVRNIPEQVIAYVVVVPGSHLVVAEGQMCEWDRFTSAKQPGLAHAGCMHIPCCVPLTLSCPCPWRILTAGHPDTHGTSSSRQGWQDLVQQECMCCTESLSKHRPSSQ